MNPGATEGPPGNPTCSDSQDNDCDGDVDLDDIGCIPCDDNDGDEYGDPASPSCTYPEEDCDDSNPNINPGATEDCGPDGKGNGIDENCNGATDESCNSYSATANAEASAYGGSSLTASGSLNTLALLLVPVGAVIALRIWRRKR